MRECIAHREQQCPVLARKGDFYEVPRRKAKWNGSHLLAHCDAESSLTQLLVKPPRCDIGIMPKAALCG